MGGIDRQTAHWPAGLLFLAADMLWIWAALPLVLADSQLSVHTQGTESIFQGLGLRRRVRETGNNCSEGLYQGGPFCCQPCQPGEQKVKDCTNNGGAPTCAPCTEGKEYMDKKHYSDKCRRCTLCDEGHGLEVETNCTRTQDTKCKCKPNFYCDSSGCEHCVQCTLCEHGTLEHCTPTSNAKCKKQSSKYHFLWLSLIPVLIISFVFIYKKCWKRHHDDPESGIPSPESMPMNVSDVNLDKYISRIAEQMTISQVRKFARENDISESKIDEIKHDNFQNTAEEKTKLLQCWYQSHGKNGAHAALIRGLKKANCRAVVENIQAMVREDRENSTSDLSNENEGQRLE
ncbi:tumor necrosis factor receptor superfamily member 6 isoform X1 [Apodemus sylvaticus]|uniref:tumor necrosis factor receptor superfamily member 6 isoform X1 n=1 Tax=Apodemus sylvaticus TaxID=10129 RepID=UPI002241BA97|nr:tumor necrosis factor receptor superfamily member 6 isoform X1 [Apodemus sylvaticus]